MFKRGEENVFDTLQIGRVIERKKEKLLSLIEKIAKKSRSKVVKLEEDYYFGYKNSEIFGYKFKFFNSWIGIFYIISQDLYMVAYQKEDGDMRGAGWLMKEEFDIFLKVKMIKKIIRTNFLKDSNEISNSRK
jgi:hypothetical protein